MYVVVPDATAVRGGLACHMRPIRPRRWVAACGIAAVTSLAAAPAAPAALTAKATFVTISGAPRLEVGLTSTTALNARTRPRSVRVRLGKRTVRLKRVAGARAAAVSAGTWRSARLRGASLRAAQRLTGKRISVLVGTRRGLRRMSTTLALPAAGGGGGGVTPPPPPPPPPPPVIHTEPVPDIAGFTEVVSKMYLYRTYPVVTSTTNAVHDESYKFCPGTLKHHFEGLAYIYDSEGPWKVLEGAVNTDRSKGNGVIEFTQQTANFAEEVGKVQQIRITWGTTPQMATVTHPEITPAHDFSVTLGQNAC